LSEPILTLIIFGPKTLLKGCNPLPHGYTPLCVKNIMIELFLKRHKPMPLKHTQALARSNFKYKTVIQRFHMSRCGLVVFFFDLKEVMGSKFHFLSLTKLQFSLIKLENHIQVLTL